MRKLAVVAAAALAACGGTDLSQKMKDALPNRGIQVGSPQSATRMRSAQPQSQVGDHSHFYDLTYGLALSVNVSVAWVLGVVEAVTANKPTSCTSNSCTWGPGSGALDPVQWKLVVNRRTSPAEHYEFALSGEPKATAGSGFVTVLSGTVFPSGAPHHGNGEFLLDIDAAQQLKNDGGRGKIDVTFDNVGALKVGVSFLGMKDSNDPTQSDDAGYAYADDASGGGDLQIAAKNLTTGDELTLHSRWLSTGAGRGDAQFFRAAGQVTASECWTTPPFDVAYFASSDPADLGPDSGVESSCAFAPAAWATIQVP